jgi:hypothetical protein
MPLAALETLNKGGFPESVVLSNKALCLLVIANIPEAQAIFDQLISSNNHDQLRYYTIPYVDDLVYALPDRPDIAAARDRLKKFVWPDGLGAELEDDMRKAVLKRLERKPYPFPMYCQLSGIQGLFDDGILAERILRNDNSSEKTIALWTIGRSDRIFGRCNFKQSNDAEYDFKFCDSTDMILSRNLRLFAGSYEVRRLLFLEPRLLEKFESVIATESLQITCALADAPTTS